MTRRSYCQHSRIRSSFLEEDVESEPPSKSEIVINQLVPEEVLHGYVNLSGTGCDRGWQVLIIDQFGKSCYLTPCIAAPNSIGGWSVGEYRVGGRTISEATSKRSIYALSVRWENVKRVQRLFEQNSIEETSDLENLLNSNKIPFKLSSGRALVQIVSKQSNPMRKTRN